MHTCISKCIVCIEVKKKPTLPHSPPGVRMASAPFQEPECERRQNNNWNTEIYN